MCGRASHGQGSVRTGSPRLRHTARGLCHREERRAIGAPGEEDPSIPEKNAALTAAYRGTASAGSGTDRGTRIRATPRARRLAREHHIDLEKVRAETGADLIDETVLAPYLPA